MSQPASSTKNRQTTRSTRRARAAASHRARQDVGGGVAPPRREKGVDSHLAHREPVVTDDSPGVAVVPGSASCVARTLLVTALTLVRTPGGVRPVGTDPLR
ncbi:hypothetical protein GCM10027605_11540 [Micromonospora zhanjiangensis]